ILTLHNTGQADLNVSVIGGSVQTTLKDCSSGASITPPVVFVAAGATVVTNIGCVSASCPGGLTVSAVVQGTAGAGVNQLCIFDTVGTVITTAASSCQNCVTCVPPVPCISVTKGIVCAPATGVAGCNSSLTYGLDATGVVGTNNPAFCYSITVSNCGTTEGLTGVTVTDNLIPSVAGAFSSTLAIGASETHFFGQSYGLGDHTNTVTATAKGAISSASVSAHASAAAHVIPASVTCQLNLTNDFQINSAPTNGCDVQFVNGTANSSVQVILTLHNTGQADLNVGVIGGSVQTTLTDCGSGASIPPPVVFVAAGATVVTNIGCVNASCPGGLT